MLYGHEKAYKTTPVNIENKVKIDAKVPFPQDNLKLIYNFFP